MLSLTIFAAFAAVLGTASASGVPLSKIKTVDSTCAAFYRFILASQGIPGKVAYQQILVPYTMTINGTGCAENINLDFWYLHVPMMQYDCNSSTLEDDDIDGFCCSQTAMAKKNSIFLRYWNAGFYGKQNCTASDGSIGCQWIYLAVEEFAMQIFNKYCFASKDCKSLLSFWRKDFNVVGEMKIRQYARSKCFPAGSDECKNGLSASWMTDPDLFRNSMDRLLQNCLGYNTVDDWCDCDSDLDATVTPDNPDTCKCDKASFNKGRDLVGDVQRNKPINFEGAALGYLTTMYDSTSPPFCGPERQAFMDEIMDECS